MFLVWLLRVYRGFAFVGFIVLVGCDCDLLFVGNLIGIGLMVGYV